MMTSGDFVLFPAFCRSVQAVAADPGKAASATPITEPGASAVLRSLYMQHTPP
jgi:hypothetical protein